MNNATAKADDRYVPIDCHVHDELLERATLQLPTTITYRPDEPGEQQLRVHRIIVDVFSRDGAEWLHVVSEGSRLIEIRLDRIAAFGV